MSTLNAGVSLRNGKADNNETLQGVYSLASPTVTYKDTPSASTDPFAGKTNKFAESKIIRVVSTGAGVHIKAGGASITDADTSDYFIPADVVEYFAVDDGEAYVRIIQAAATATVYITEVY